MCSSRVRCYPDLARRHINRLVFTGSSWARAIGAVSLLACAVTVFALVAGPPEET